MAAPNGPASSPTPLLEFLLVGGATLRALSAVLAAPKEPGPRHGRARRRISHVSRCTRHHDPHFSVTYLLFYKDAKERAFGAAWGPVQRARYLIAGLLVPLLLAGWAIAALAGDRRRGSG